MKSDSGPHMFAGRMLDLFSRYLALFRILPLALVLFSREGVAEETGKVDPRNGEEIDIGQLKSLFQSPPNDRRILKIIHSFPKNTSAHEPLLSDLKDRGFGGVVCNIQFQDYLRSEENWRSFAHAAGLAKKMGMTLWLYDEKGYPSGTAGGLVLEGHPEWEARSVACVSKITEGDPVELRVPEGGLIDISAFPLDAGRIDLGGRVNLREFLKEEGVVKWQPPQGSWQVMAFVEQRLYEGTHAEWNLYEKRSYPNLLMREPIGRFLELTHQEYARRFPEPASTFDAIFTDEPSLMSVFLRPQPHPVIPWSPELPKRFRQRSGRDLAPLLPALFADAGRESGQVRCEFWQLVGDMVSDAYFGQIQEWCRAHGIASTGHLLWEENLAHHVGFYGDFMKCAARLDVPGIDCLTSKPGTVPFQVAKLIGSIADQQMSQKTMSETSDHAQRYRPVGDSRSRTAVSPAEIRGTCNLLYVCGINTTTSYYSWAGLTVEEQRQINDYVGRLGVMLTGGTHVCDIAVLYPTESLWAHFTPSRTGATDSPEIATINKTYNDVSSLLFRNQLDYDYVSRSALRSAKVSGDGLRIGNERYGILVLPHVDTVPHDVWEKIASFRRGGGHVVAIGVLPDNEPRAFPSKRVTKLTEEIFGTPPGKASDGATTSRSEGGGVGVFLPVEDEALLSEVIRRLYEPDCRVLSRRSPVRYMHRRIAGKEVYFLINDSANEIEEEVVLASGGHPELWDPRTGGIAAAQPAEMEADGERTRIRLRMEGFGSRFVTFDRGAKPKRKELKGPLVQKIAIPLMEAVGEVKFTILKAQHVECTTSPDGESWPNGGTPMRVDSEITMENTDSWCFAETAFSPAADFSGCEGLRISSFVPEGQSCGTRLLVILREESGADYFVDANRPLNLAGWRTSTVWFDTFALAGWSEDNNGRLDGGKVAALRIGWGGYKSGKGETVRFAIGDVHLIGVDDTKKRSQGQAGMAKAR
jgi:hypothetical protein